MSIRSSWIVIPRRGARRLTQRFRVHARTICDDPTTRRCFCNFPECLYHAVYNNILNIAEAGNSATAAWIPFGNAAAVCDCEQGAHSSHICMKLSFRKHITSPPRSDRRTKMGFRFGMQQGAEFHVLSEEFRTADDADCEEDLLPIPSK
ncbi:unnamed protein product [Bemisia tabaci]|uniref:Uncharacterized protein n=1 Tax=Bemisia tabaci TaxID=7038 RepID=A0A9P0AJB3_BEMTA|nr:unnamed protein product [Bemisia tabaci]